MLQAVNIGQHPLILPNTLRSYYDLHGEEGLGDDDMQPEDFMGMFHDLFTEMMVRGNTAWNSLKPVHRAAQNAHPYVSSASLVDSWIPRVESNQL